MKWLKILLLLFFLFVLLPLFSSEDVVQIPLTDFNQLLTDLKTLEELSLSQERELTKSLALQEVLLTDNKALLLLLEQSEKDLKNTNDNTIVWVITGVVGGIFIGWVSERIINSFSQ